MKECHKCHQMKSTDDFRSDPRYSEGRRNWCKACEVEYARQRRKTFVPTTAVAEKYCARCGQLLASDSFRRNTSATDGLQSWCIVCERKYKRDWARNKWQTNEVYAEEQRVLLRERARKYRQDPECIARNKQYSIDYYCQNKVQIRARQKLITATPEDRAKRYAYYHRRGKFLRQTPRYREVAVTVSARRRARKLSAPGAGVTKEQWAQLLEAYNHLCAYCGASSILEQDHVVPLSCGGSHDISNIVPACRSCNARKNDKTPEEAGMTLRLCD